MSTLSWRHLRFFSLMSHVVAFSFFCQFPFLLRHYHPHHNFYHYHLIPRPEWLKICFVSILRFWYHCSQENPNCSVQWTGSCFLPKSSVSNWSNSTRAKTTGEGTFHHQNFWPVTNTKHILKKIPSSIKSPIRAISVLLGEAWKSLAAEDRELYSGKAKV